MGIELQKKILQKRKIQRVLGKMNVKSTSLGGVSSKKETICSCPCGFTHTHTHTQVQLQCYTFIWWHKQSSCLLFWQKSTCVVRSVEWLAYLSLVLWYSKYHDMDSNIR